MVKTVHWSLVISFNNEKQLYQNNQKEFDFGSIHEVLKIEKI